jgi:hypothetical protein
MAASWDFGGSSSGSGNTSWGDLSSPRPTPPPIDGAESGFGRPAAAPSGGQGTSAPALWLTIGLLLALLGIVVGVISNSFWLAAAAWLLGGPVAIGLLALFVHTDTTRRANPWYAESALAGTGRRFLVLLSLIGVALNAWTMADFFARGGF